MKKNIFCRNKKLILILTISKLCREFVEKAISRRQQYFSGEMSSSKFLKTNSMWLTTFHNKEKLIVYLIKYTLLYCFFLIGFESLRNASIIIFCRLITCRAFCSNSLQSLAIARIKINFFLKNKKKIFYNTHRRFKIFLENLNRCNKKKIIFFLKSFFKKEILFFCVIFFFYFLKKNNFNFFLEIFF